MLSVSSVVQQINQTISLADKSQDGHSTSRQSVNDWEAVSSSRQPSSLRTLVSTAANRWPESRLKLKNGLFGSKTYEFRPTLSPTSPIPSPANWAILLIVSAVKICKNCLQTASAFGWPPPTVVSPLNPTGDFRPQTPWLYPQLKIFGATTYNGLESGLKYRLEEWGCNKYEIYFKVQIFVFVQNK